MANETPKKFNSLEAMGGCSWLLAAGVEAKTVGEKKEQPESVQCQKCLAAVKYDPATESFVVMGLGNCLNLGG